MKLDIKDHPSDSLISTFFTPYKSASEQISSVCHALIKTFSSSPPLFLPPLLHDQAIHKRNVETLCSNIYPSAFFPPFPLKHNTLLLSNQLAISLFDIFHRSKGKQKLRLITLISVQALQSFMGQKDIEGLGNFIYLFFSFSKIK